MHDPRRGDEVRIEFLDHVEDHHDPMHCVVWGRVHRVTKAAVTVACWDHRKPTWERDDRNTKTFTILRSCITDLQAWH
jgi:uncharacterized protein involved in type VI secretion and phage assembly